MNSEDAAGLGGPIKKPTDSGAGKLGGGLSAGGKSIGGDASPAPAAPTPAGPPTPMSFEFEDEPTAAPEPKKEAAPAPAFNPFDEPVEVPPANVSQIQVPELPGTARVDKNLTNRILKTATNRIEKPVTGRIEKPGTGRIEKTGTGSFVNPAADSDDGDIAPGLARNLWQCPHCGAKNKPHRETCRECKKSPQDPVEKPWFLQPLIMGPAIGGLVLFVLLVMWLTTDDLSLRPAGTLDKVVRYAGAPTTDLRLDETRKFTIRKTAAVSGRVIYAKDYPIAPWLQVVVIGLGSSAKDDTEFSTWTAEFDGDGMVVKATRSATLFLIHEDTKPELKTGDYISVVGKAGVPEQDHRIVKGTDNPNCWTIKVEQIDTK